MMVLIHSYLTLLLFLAAFVCLTYSAALSRSEYRDEKKGFDEESGEVGESIDEEIEVEKQEENLDQKGNSRMKKLPFRLVMMNCLRKKKKKEGGQQKQIQV